MSPGKHAGKNQAEKADGRTVGHPPGRGGAGAGQHGAAGIPRPRRAGTPAEGF